MSVWTASEFNSMKQLRTYFRKDREVPPADIYISSYWKLGSTDEQHKMAKKADATG